MVIDIAAAANRGVARHIGGTQADGVSAVAGKRGRQNQCLCRTGSGSGRSVACTLVDCQSGANLGRKFNAWRRDIGLAVTRGAAVAGSRQCERCQCGCDTVNGDVPGRRRAGVASRISGGRAEGFGTLTHGLDVGAAECVGPRTTAIGCHVMDIAAAERQRDLGAGL